MVTKPCGTKWRRSESRESWRPPSSPQNATAQVRSRGATSRGGPALRALGGGRGVRLFGAGSRFEHLAGALAVHGFGDCPGHRVERRARPVDTDHYRTAWRRH